MNNFGMFVEHVGDHNVSIGAFEATNSALEKFDDVSMFFQDIGPKPSKNNFGMFNATDIAHFSGKLVVTFADGLKVVKKEVNKRKVYYYFGLEKNKRIYDLLESTDNVEIICKEVDAPYVRTKLGREPIICNDLSKVSEVV